MPDEAVDGVPAIAKRLTEQVLAPLKRAFVGKDEIVDVLGVCLCAGEHAFLLGPPGTAKSALVIELARRLEGDAFSYLLTRFTEPSELFGPFDIRRLREGELVTNTAGMLPEASLVFLDELLNANSAILNSLLTVLNERVFRRGRETRRLPLLMVVGASNRLPEEDALAALFDRFLMRVHCDNVDDSRLGDVLDAGWRLEAPAAPAGTSVSVADIRRLHQALVQVDLAAVRAPFLELVQRLRRAGLQVSDRRAVKIQRLVAASALLCQRSAAHVSDLWVFRHIWDTEEQREVLTGTVVEVAGNGADAGIAVHPAARGTTAPDPEALARDLDAVAARLDAAATDHVLRAQLADRTRALAARCEWVEDEQQRGFLRQRLETLWTRLDLRR
jgi:MoxR-like ATPase